MIRRFLAWLTLASSVLLPPVALGVLGFHDWGRLSLTSPTDIRLLLAVLTVIGWIAWAGWTLSVVSEFGSLRGRRRRAVPGFGWAQAIAGALLTAALSSAVSGPALAVPVEGAGLQPLTAPGTAVSWTTSDLAGDDSVPTRAAPLGVPVTGTGERAAGEDGESGQARRGSVTHVVESGDDLWTLAERYYGSGTDWRTIVAANPQLQTDPTADLPVGMVLSIERPVRLVTVVRGDTLSGLAEQYLGDADRWPEIHDLNRARVIDPDLIDVGWVLRVPLLTAVDVPGSATSSQSDTNADGDGTGVDGARVDASADGDATGVDAEGAGADDGTQERGTPGSGDNAAGGGSSGGPVPDTSGSTPRTGDTSVLATDDGAGAGPSEATAAAVWDHRALTGVVGGLTTLTASAVLGGVMVRRRLQVQSRPVGRRFLQPGEEATRVASALGIVGGLREPDREDLLEHAMRLLSGHWRSLGEFAPILEQAVVRDLDVEFTFKSDPGTPEGFQKVGNRLAVAWARLRELPPVEAPVAYPALVTLGEVPDQRDLVMVDLVASGVVGVRGDGDGLAAEALSAMLVELACAPWAAELRLLVVTEDQGFAHIAGTHRVRTLADPATALAEVDSLVRQRREALGDRAWPAVRLDPDLADAWAPHVVLFESPLADDQSARLQAMVENAGCGVAAVLPVGRAAGEASWEVTGRPGAAEVNTPGAPSLVPQTLPASTRAAIRELYTLADADTSERAPWWAEDPEEPVDIIEIRPAPAPAGGPYVRLLGPIDLVGAAGEPPTRALRQCVEYCAWLLEHPGGTATQMASQLFVTDATRRSNLSRLRAWLGEDPDGGQYLPDAYSGRIHLHQAVRSDWQDLIELTAGGINRMPYERLRLALSLVRGAPLADASPGQWGWAEGVRTDMSALIRDLGVVASRTARERGDLDVSRWAATRALVAAPDDELLLAERIRTERASGRSDEVERLITRLHRQARTLGVDLLPETIDLIQEVMEGRLRSRQA